MLISLIIPTRDRAEFLVHSLRTCTRIQDSEVEIIVSDNASSDATSDVMAEFSDPRIKYFNTGQRLSMRQNFEFGLQKSTGDYVLMMGDDDAILPAQFAYARQLLETHRPDSLTGRQLKYIWPGNPPEVRPGYLKFSRKDLFGEPTILDAKQIRSAKPTTSGPGLPLPPIIYGGFVSQAAVQKLRRISGEVFCASWPDIYFMYAAAAVIEKHVSIRHPFFVAGGGKKSTGASLQRKRVGEQAQSIQKFEEELKADPIIDPIPRPVNLVVGMLSMMAAAKRQAVGENMNINYQIEIERALASLRTLDHDRRCEGLASLRTFSEDLGLPTTVDVFARMEDDLKLNIVEKDIKSRTTVEYLMPNRISINGIKRGILNVDQAARTYDYLIGEQAAASRSHPTSDWLRVMIRAMSTMIVNRKPQ